MSEWVGGYKGGYVGNRARHTNYRASESPHSCEPSCPHHKGRTALVWSCPAGYMGGGSLLCWEFFRSRMLPPQVEGRPQGKKPRGWDEAQGGTLSTDSEHRPPTQWVSPPSSLAEPCSRHRSPSGGCGRLLPPTGRSRHCLFLPCWRGTPSLPLV